MDHPAAPIWITIAVSAYIIANVAIAYFHARDKALASPNSGQSVGGIIIIASGFSWFAAVHLLTIYVVTVSTTDITSIDPKIIRTFLGFIAVTISIAWSMPITAKVLMPRELTRGTSINLLNVTGMGLAVTTIAACVLGIALA